MMNPLAFYDHATPDTAKVALFLKESALPDRLMPVDIARGEQHTPASRAIDPNGKVPALADDGIAFFDSSAILQQLGENTGAGAADPLRGRGFHTLPAFLEKSTRGLPQH